MSRKPKKLLYAHQVNKFIGEFGDLFYDAPTVMCKVCDKSLMCWSKYDCTRHVQSVQHQKKKQGVPLKTQFLFDLLVMLIACNIPFHTLDKQAFRRFWDKYNPQIKLPSRASLSNHVPTVRGFIIDKLKCRLQNRRLWLCIDETTDRQKNHIVNIIVRVLDPRRATFPLLLASKRLAECTGNTITRVVLETLEQFELSTSQVVMFVTDSDPTMLSAGRLLSERDCRFLHVICKVHDLHLVAETIRQSFPKVDALLASTTKVFLKSLKHLREFHRKCPDFPEPPQPILTRGTWLKTVFYYAEHFQQIKAAILEFNPVEVAAIEESQTEFQDLSVETALKTIHNNYKGLYDAIEKLQNSSLSLAESLQIVDEVNSLLQTVGDPMNEPVKNKFENVLKTDADFDRLRRIHEDLCVRDNDIFCNLCDRIINTCKKYNVTRHVRSHGSGYDPTFLYDLTVALVASDIPFHKLSRPALREFLEKYMNRKLPHPNTLRNRYVADIYRDVVRQIRGDIADNCVYFSIDEATDASGRSVAHFVIGALKSNGASDCHLVASKVLGWINHDTLVNFVTECFHTIWPDRDNSNKVLVMLSDSAAYMLKAGTILSEIFPNMVHVTCAARALNRIAETVKDSFPVVNELIEGVTRIFIKAPIRRNAFKAALPDTPLPPEPVVGKCGTWLEAVAYYDEHFEGIQRAVSSFDPNASSAVHTVQNLLQVQKLRDDIRCINSNYAVLTNAIKKLETYGISLQEQFRVLNNVKDYLNHHNTHTVVKEKMQDAFKKNPGYNILEQLCLFLTGPRSDLPPALQKYSAYTDNFAYCPLVTVDVERTCSVREVLLSDKRRSFTTDTLEKYMVIKFHYRHRSADGSDTLSD
ncbi:hypothetical protein NQ318_004775 [Aromia moschata]|uniref:DUF659 domain-containing protein n=1 Tax=Aromia moschata TaxID=1265417 RepID=A0AAV8XQT1_9CUCU|nr:hypothetical protein NQ318_004775 [Aromia moschata]